MIEEKAVEDEEDSSYSTPFSHLSLEPFQWPVLVNESWKAAAIRAADSWGMSLSDYLKEGEKMLRMYKREYRQSRSMHELCPLTKPINATEKTLKFCFRARR